MDVKHILWIMGNISFDRIMGRFAEALGLGSDKAIAECLGMSATAYSNRKVRGSVPFEEVLEYLYSHNMDLAKMLSLGPEPYEIKPASAHQLFDNRNDYIHSEAPSGPRESLDVLVCKRFKEEMKRTKLSYGEVASACDVTTKTVSRWGSSTPIPSDKLQCLLQTSIDIIYVLTGVRSYHGLISENTAYQNNDFAQIPRYNVQAAAGHGAFNDDEEQLQPLAFRRDWLAKRHLSPASLVIVDVSGNSMEPNLRDGDMVLVDRDQTEVTSGKTYVLRIDGNLFVKNLQLLPQGLVQVCSFNHGFAPYQVDLSNEALDMAVIGRVVASMHEW